MQDQPEGDQMEKERLALEAERAALEAERAALRAARAAADAGAGGQADTGIGTGRLIVMIVAGLAGGLLWGFVFGLLAGSILSWLGGGLIVLIFFLITAIRPSLTPEERWANTAGLVMMALGVAVGGLLGGMLIVYWVASLEYY